MRPRPTLHRPELAPLARVEHRVSPQTITWHAPSAVWLGLETFLFGGVAFLFVGGTLGAAFAFQLRLRNAAVPMLIGAGFCAYLGADYREDYLTVEAIEVDADGGWQLRNGFGWAVGQVASYEPRAIYCETWHRTRVAVGDVKSLETINLLIELADRDYRTDNGPADRVRAAATQLTDLSKAIGTAR